MIGFGEASKRYFTLCLDFQGRATRSEYWFAMLMYWLVFIGLFLLIGATSTRDPVSGQSSTSFIGIIATFILLVFVLFSALAGLSLGVRPLHDQNKSGWLHLISLVPLGTLVLYVFFCMDGTHGANQYGEDPYQRRIGDIFR